MVCEIIICEDSVLFSRELKRKFEQLITDEKSNLLLASCKVVTYNNNFTDLLKRLADEVDAKKFAYILDIELKYKYDGIQLAKKIREIDYDGNIIFLSQHEDFKPKTFGHNLKVLDFINKFDKAIDKRLKESFKCIIRDFELHYTNPELALNQKISLVSSRTTNFIELNDIMYFIPDGNRKLLLFTESGKIISVSGSLREIERKWSQRGLVRSHKECVVNATKISQLYKNRNDMFILLQNGAKCSLSKKYYDKLIYFINQIGNDKREIVDE